MSELVPTKPQPAAPFVAWGLGLSLIGVPLLLASAYAEITYDRSSYDTSQPGMPFAVAGWAAVLIGAVLLVIGAFRLARHADRAAGVKYPAAPSGSTTWHDEKSAAAAAEAVSQSAPPSE